MFKKLKDKIAEEVKISPQRIQQFTQSVQDKINQSISTDDNLFSIGEDGEFIGQAYIKVLITSVNTNNILNISLIKELINTIIYMFILRSTVLLFMLLVLYQQIPQRQISTLMLVFLTFPLTTHTTEGYGEILTRL